MDVPEPGIRFLPTLQITLAALLVHPERTGLHAFGVRRELVGLVIAAAVQIAPDGGSLGLVGRPLLFCAIEIVGPLENQTAWHRQFVGIAKDVDEVADEHTSNEEKSSAFQVNA